MRRETCVFSLRPKPRGTRIGAPRLAARIWQQIVEQWPLSPYAPKALLAAEQLDSTRGDSARMLLEHGTPIAPIWR